MVGVIKEEGHVGTPTTANLLVENLLVEIDPVESAKARSGGDDRDNGKKTRVE